VFKGQFLYVLSSKLIVLQNQFTKLGVSKSPTQVANSFPYTWCKRAQVMKIRIRR